MITDLSLNPKPINKNNMKKILTTLAITGFAAAAFAQGTVNWSGVANLLIADTNSAVASPYSVPGGSLPNGVAQAQGTTAASTTTLFYYELLVSASNTTAPTTTSALGTWLDTGLAAQNGGAANGRILQLNSGTADTANNWANGTTMNVMLVGWSANLGTTYAAMLAFLNSGSYAANLAALPTEAFLGTSALGNLTIGSANPGITIFGTGAGQINNPGTNPMIMNVLAVPEPASIALAGLGGLSLLALRRKK